MRQLARGALMLMLTLGAGCPEKSAPVKATLAVEGMTCGSCERAIQAEVGRLEGVSNVRASHTQKKAWVTYDRNKIEIKTIIAAINRLGYRATPAAPPAGPR